MPRLLALLELSTLLKELYNVVAEPSIPLGVVLPFLHHWPYCHAVAFLTHEVF